MSEGLLRMNDTNPIIVTDPDDMGQTLATRLGDLIDTNCWEDVLIVLARIAHDEAEDRCGRPGTKFLETIGDGLEALLEAAQYPACADDPPILKVGY
jgi:hypothetical protein